MDPIVKWGFAIGFLFAAGVGVYAWRDGSPKAPDAARTEGPAVALAPKIPTTPAPAPAAPPPGGSGRAETPAGLTQLPPSPPQSGEPAKPGERSTPAAPGPIAALPPATATGPARPETPADKGAFDIVRVEPSGEMVVAGRCPAGCTVELTANGRTQDKAVADASGAFAMVPSPLPPGDHELGLRITTPDGKRETSQQSVTVSVPAAPSREVVVVLNEPGAPSKILQRPGQAPAAAAAPATGGQPPATGQGAVAARTPDAAAPKTPAEKVAALSLGAVDAESGRFFVQGTAQPGARLRVYLNNSPIAEPVAGDDGRWSLRVERGLTPGRYVARVDHLDPATGKVISRAEAAFAYEAEVAAASPRATADAVAKTPEGRSDTPAAPPGTTDGGRPSPNAAAGPSAAAPTSPGDSSRGATSGASRVEPSGPTADAGRDGRTALGDDAGPRAVPDRARPPSNREGLTRQDRLAERVPGASAGSTAPAAQGASREQARARAKSTDAARPSSETSFPTDRMAPAVTNAREAAADVAAAQTLKPTPAPPPSDAANPVVASIDTAQVRRGDSLWRISRTTYGSGRRYTVIFTANDAQIRNPNLIYPGQVLVLPAGNSGAGAARR